MLKKNGFWILSLGAFLGLLLVASPEWLERIFKASPDSLNKNLILDVYGKVEKRPTQSNTYETVQREMPLSSGDTVITHEDSKVLFGFSPSFWLMPYSKMEFVRGEERWTGRLIYGEIRQIEVVKPSSDLIALVYNSQPITEKEFSSARETIITPLASTDSENFQELSAKEGLPQNILEKQIFQTLLLHKKFFQTCFIKYYKKKSGQIRGGETLFDLLIDVTGTIESARVNRTDIGDADYLQCLQLVFARMRFKNFKTEAPIHALFPLYVELPEEN
jgi:hypothetical protein